MTAACGRFRTITRRDPELGARAVIVVASADLIVCDFFSASPEAYARVTSVTVRTINENCFFIVFERLTSLEWTHLFQAQSPERFPHGRLHRCFLSRPEWDYRTEEGPAVYWSLRSDSIRLRDQRPLFL